MLDEIKFQCAVFSKDTIEFTMDNRFLGVDIIKRNGDLQGILLDIISAKKLYDFIGKHLAISGIKLD